MAYNKLIESGVTFVDTSENYGLVSRKDNLSAEHIIGQCVEENSERTPLIASTLSNPWTSIKQGTGLRLGARSILSAISKSAERMGASAIDLYQVPAKMFYLGTPGCVVQALAMAMDQGLINNVGVCNMEKSAMKSFIQKLSKKGYTLTSNQFEFSLVNRKALKSGLIKACKDLGVIPIAHTPLGRGLATGIYTATNPTGGQVSGKQPFPFETLEKYSTLHTMLATVQKKVRIRLEKENRDLQDRRGRYRGESVRDLGLLELIIFGNTNHICPVCRSTPI
jgi:aryl-alcohol dehydrogenase-like predicted oxidoreductase